MSEFWQHLVDSFSPAQKLILKVCAVVIALGLSILGIDRFIVQPRQAPSTEPAAFDASSIRVERPLPKLDLGLDEQVRRTHRELEALRLEREHQVQKGHEGTQPDAPERDDPF
ncbi:hypothetical protein [Wenzhouxiangella marina]|uniref:Uncharacterized protein n=1 Tax=Wenzhouxiangella marina TaxID=1579979 RepID=A0A0K0XUC3_9GAMM|nr:hypothetical protein [Wenzhouxiangella marina]AKS41216.1 hypothetical protein WM2015_835 [Wenzhouxiangella marina]MBB6088096.1 hypothetical protein [Wenzhouxiangella marina]